MRRWKGESPTSAPVWLSSASRSELLAKLAEVESERAQFLKHLTDEQLEAPIVYRTLNGQEYRNKLADLVRHLVNHSTYHRGQVATQLRQLGTAPPSTDFIQYRRQTA